MRLPPARSPTHSRHNHPSGNLEPSSADVQVTRQLKAAGEALTIPVVDSLVVGFDGRYTSLAERGLT